MNTVTPSSAKGNAHAMQTSTFPHIWRFRHYLVDYPTCRVKQVSIVVLDALEAPFEDRKFPDTSLKCEIAEDSLDRFLEALAQRVGGETILQSTVWSSPSTESVFPLILQRCANAMTSRYRETLGALKFPS